MPQKFKSHTWMSTEATASVNVCVHLHMNKIIELLTPLLAWAVSSWQLWNIFMEKCLGILLPAQYVPVK